jgi:IS5 family transposase
MIESNYEEVHSKEWIKRNISDPSKDLVILRNLIPWERTIKQLVQYYDQEKGAIGKNLRMMAAIVLLMRLRGFSDRGVIAEIQENRYMQHFCNISDEQLSTFIDHSTICKFRRRLGVEGMAMIENEIFQHLRRSGAIANEMSLIDSTVLESNIIYPNDVHLVFSAIKRMSLWAKKHKVALWFNHSQVKKLWRRFHQDKQANRLEYLQLFDDLFTPALSDFESISPQSRLSQAAVLEAESLVALFKILDKQTQLKLTGEVHIKDRLVSLKEVDARPIQKGKAFPDCEFGTTNQMCFNRQGFLIHCQILPGAPKDKTLYPSTLEAYIQRMEGNPWASVSDGGFRSEKNLKAHADEIQVIFMGSGEDVKEEEQEAALSARSATEGFIAVAKNLRGFGKSLYVGLRGDQIWASLNQAAYNLKKFLQLYREEAYDESVLIALGLWSR